MNYCQSTRPNDLEKKIAIVRKKHRNAKLQAAYFRNGVEVRKYAEGDTVLWRIANAGMVGYHANPDEAWDESAKGLGNENNNSHETTVNRKRPMPLAEARQD